jgi:hypothetical protein
MVSSLLFGRGYGTLKGQNIPMFDRRVGFCIDISKFHLGDVGALVFQHQGVSYFIRQNEFRFVAHIMETLLK